MKKSVLSLFMAFALLLSTPAPALAAGGMANGLWDDDAGTSLPGVVLDELPPSADPTDGDGDGDGDGEGDGLDDDDDADTFTGELAFPGAALDIYRYEGGKEVYEDGKYYYVDANEQKVYGFVLYDSGRIMYFGEEDGDRSLKKDTLEIDGETYWFEKNWGNLLTGEFSIEKDTWKYLDPTTLTYAKNGFYLLPGDDRILYYDAQGNMAKGVTKIGGDFYKFGTGNGNLITGEVYIESQWYYLDVADAGAEKQGIHQLPDGRSLGYIKDELFQLPDGRWVYYNNKGQMVKTEYKLNGQNVIFSSVTGALRIGEVYKADGEWYYFDFANWKWIEGDYHILEDGRKVYYDENGRMVHGHYILPNGTPTYFDDYNGGEKAAGEHYTAEGWKYLSPSTMNWLTNDWRVEADGRTWYYNEKGLMVHGERKIGDWTYSFNTVTGVLNFGEVQIGGNWYYLKSDRTYETGGLTNLPDGRWVYYASNGVMQKGTVNIGIFPYVFNSTTGKLQTGEVQVNGNWYYMDTSGKTPAYITSQFYTIGNKTVYYNEQGIMLKGAHTINGIDYYFDPSTGALTQRGYLRGIDISSNQGNVDWAALKASGEVDFVILRVLAWDKYAGSSGEYKIDDNFLDYYKQAKAHGFLVGAYLYSYTTSEARAEREVNFIYNSIQWQQIMAMGGLDLPLFVDYEDKYIITNTNGMSIAERTNLVWYEMVLIENYAKARGWSVTPGFYANKDWSTRYISSATLQEWGFPFWIAVWPVAGLAGSHNWSPQPYMWQWTSDGTVPGINGRVDRNILYL